jgi:hypothetical protein
MLLKLYVLLFLRPVTFSCFSLYSGGIANANAIFLSRCRELLRNPRLRCRIPNPSTATLFMTVHNPQASITNLNSLPARHREVAFLSVELNSYVCHVGQTPGDIEKAAGSGGMVGPVA